MTRMLPVTWVGLMLIIAAGCDGASGGPQPPDKSGLTQGKADGEWCADLGFDANCDVCDEYGWYGDGECDQALVDQGVCLQPDPDCAAATCMPTDARGVGSCMAELGFVWDGQHCSRLGGCSCEGLDCGRLFRTQSECAAAAVACGPCGPMAAAGVGSCMAQLGFAWDGQGCVRLGGCSCEGADCARLFATLDACTAATAQCAP